MAVFALTHGLKLRPHAKTHKSAELALLQMAQGAVGVCVQKIDEALALAQGGVTNIYITNEVLATVKLARLAAGRPRLPPPDSPSRSTARWASNGLRKRCSKPRLTA